MIISRNIIDPDTGVCIIVADGAPTDINAPIGSLYVRRDGAASTTLYSKIGAANSDWEAIESSTAGIDWTAVTGKPSGLVSSSIQAEQWTVLSSSFAVSASWSPSTENATPWEFVTGKPSGLVSSSVQVILQDTTGNLSGSRIVGLVASSSNALTASFALNATEVNWANLTDKPVGLVSSSVQIDYNNIQNTPTTIPTASLAVTASYAISASLAQTASRAISSSQSTRAEEFLGRAIFPEGLYVDNEIRALHLSSSTANISSLTASALLPTMTATNATITSASVGWLFGTVITGSAIAVPSASIGAISSSAIVGSTITATSASAGWLNATTLTASVARVENLTAPIFSASVANIPTITGSRMLVTTASIALANITTAAVGLVSASMVLSAGLRMSFVTKTANYTVTAQDYTVLADATAGNIVVTLPVASSLSGQILNIKKVDSTTNQVILSSSSGIDDGSSATLTVQYENITVQSHNTTWGIL